MKKTFLTYHYSSLRLLFKKLQRRLYKSFSSGKFQQLSQVQQQRLLKRMYRLQVQLFRLNTKIKYGSLAFVTAAGISFLPSEAFAQLATSGSEFQANTFTTNVQQNPKVATDNDGDFVITWSSRGQDDGSEYGIYAQRYNAAGVAQGSEFRVNTYVTGRQNNPVIAMDDNGNFVIAWTSNGQDGNLGGVYFQRFNAAGIAQGSETQVNTTTSGNQYSPAIAMDSDGDFAITWSSSQDPSYGIYARRYDAAGAAASGEIHVNTTEAGVQRFSTIAMDDNGDFVIAWAGDGQDGSSYGVYGQRFNSAGTKQGSEFKANTYTTNAQRYANVAMDADGDFVISWGSGGQDGNGDGIYAQRYNASGVAQGSEFQVNTYTTGTQSFPAAAMDDAGNFIITWQSPQDGSGSGVYAQRYNAAGVAQGSEFLVNTYTTNDQRSPAIAIDSDQHVVIAWTSGGQDGSSDGVYAQLYRINLAPTDITLSSSSVAENVTAATTIGTLSATDPNTGNTFTFTLVSGTGSTDNDAFTISGNALQINASPDYETKNSYSIRVRVEDQNSLSYEEVLTITVTDVVETSTLDHAFSDHIQLYPNPAKESMVNINLEGTVQVRILNLIGTVVKEQTINNSIIDVAGLTPGVYMIELTQDNKTGVKKLIIE